MIKNKENHALLNPSLDSITNSAEKPLLKAKPFVKWVGSKRSALEHLQGRILEPSSYNTYYECFLGGGALFFKIQPEKAKLYDINLRLIITYQTIKKNVNDVIRELRKHQKLNSKDYFLACRNKFNKEKSLIKLAGLFIYLNKTCFNGLYRVNKKGDFNVPYGKYKNPKILDEENLINVSKLLKKKTIENKSFENTKIEKGAFYYIDPPYHKTFDQYDENKFNLKDHSNLRNFCKEINRAGGYFMLSNSNTKEIRNLYKNYKIETINVGKSVSCKSSGRGKEKELIIRNYE